MARTPIVGGNWKMNTVRASAVELALAVSRDAADAIEAGVEVAVFPPFPHLERVVSSLSASAVSAGAQERPPDRSPTGPVRRQGAPDGVAAITR